MLVSPTRGTFVSKYLRTLVLSLLGAVLLVGSACSRDRPSGDGERLPWGGDDDDATSDGDDDSGAGDDDSSSDKDDVGGDDDSAAGDDDDSAVADDDGPSGADDDDDSSGTNPMPDFSLVDQNPNSPRYNLPVSPRDYLQKVSGWYFGHAT